ncbi:MAG: hypothetical protein HWE25_08415 [Alphaproteobacteria bacterium]|nr:hypothetical protein [Alphaproteobacteria bacterium]
MTVECPAERMVSLSQIRVFLREEAEKFSGDPYLSFRGELIFSFLFRLYLYAGALFVGLPVAAFGLFGFASGFGQHALSLEAIVGITILGMMWLGFIWTTFAKPPNYLWTVFDKYCDNEQFKAAVRHFIQECQNGTFFVYVRNDPRFIEVKPVGRGWGKPLNLLQLLLFDRLPTPILGQHNQITSAHYLFDSSEFNRAFSLDEQDHTEPKEIQRFSDENSLESVSDEAGKRRPAQTVRLHESFPSWQHIQHAITTYSADRQGLGKRGRVMRALLSMRELDALQDFLSACLSNGLCKDTKANRLSLAALLSVCAYIGERGQASVSLAEEGIHFSKAVQKYPFHDKELKEYPEFLKRFISIYAEKDPDLRNYDDKAELANRGKQVVRIDQVYRNFLDHFTYLIDSSEESEDRRFPCEEAPRTADP